MLIPPSEILITSDLIATVQALHFTTGEQVKGGQPVLMLFDHGGKYASQLETAQLTLDVAQNLYDTTKATVTQQLQQAEFDMASLQQQLQQAEYDLQALLVNAHKQDS
ncbi:MAG: TolC family protein [Candidatus Peribacteria bacterium]|jgi:multidrug efflux pump subunit AcrA (membrane-fusion protein)|nr:TolC family protein [Candidatus Peribacteria bacterium]